VVLPARIEMVYVPGGSFLMGSPESEANRRSAEGPQRQVTVPSFYIGKYEVTQAQWGAVMGGNPSKSKSDDLPVETVSWEDAKEFCRKLSQMAGEEYRLPTEAEWEYACRARTTGAFAGDLEGMAWYVKNSGARTHPVGQKQPNAFGLYDMHGNVWEWCEDNWHNSYNSAPTDGSAWVDISAISSARVFRGGGWYFHDVLCRSADRSYGVPDFRNGYIGFRIVRAGG
jgi:formylglycine-generating enzyme required for sulfatase activity